MTILSLCFATNNVIPAQTLERVWLERGGTVVIEAESTLSPLATSSWSREAAAEATGGAALIWRGPPSWQDANHSPREYRPFAHPHAVLRYRFEVRRAGRYWIKLRNRHAHEDGDNDIWVSVNQGSFGKYYDWETERWSWDETGAWGLRELKPGVHTLEVAGRSVGFAVDRIVIFRDGGTDVERWTDIARPEEYVDRLEAPAENWKPLAPVDDLSGWETYLARPHPSVEIPDLPRDADGRHTSAIGVGRDPTQVFTISRVDGRPTLHFSGQIFGSLTTRAEHANYHLRLQVRWGEKKWPPREDRVRDSGLLYHVFGPLEGRDGFWAESIELQIQEGDFGDLFAIGQTRARVRARLQSGFRPIYDPTADWQTFERGRQPAGHSCIKLRDCERKDGGWNTVELLCMGDESVHVSNGVVVMRLGGLEKKVGDTWLPLTSGRIGLQSEGASVEFREIEIRPLSEMPALVRNEPVHVE